MMRLAEGADIELVGNGLAVDCVDQRVHCSGCGRVKIEVIYMRFIS
ncbi:MAG: hypothetical protein ACI8TL_002065 [Natronomonas sp.]